MGIWHRPVHLLCASLIAVFVTGPVGLATTPALGLDPEAAAGIGQAPPDPPFGNCGYLHMTVGEVQGSGAQSPYLYSYVEVEGTVVGDFQQGGLDGYFIQDEGDQLERTSDGIFVHDRGGDAVRVGDYVRVSGVVLETDGLTQIETPQVLTCATGTRLPEPWSLFLPLTEEKLERSEGMRVTLPQTLAILEHADFASRGELTLGRARQFEPTTLYEPGSAQAVTLAATNAANRITLDDGRSVRYPDPAIHPNGAEFTLKNRFRAGDTVSSATGVLDPRFGDWRVHPTQLAYLTVQNPRPPVPTVGGSIRVASFALGDYYTTLGVGGADNAEEFARQEAKLVTAVTRMDADVVGLTEIENSPQARAKMVQALNAKMGEQTYAVISTPSLGVHPTSPALIYQPARVSPVGIYAVLSGSEDQRFNDEKNRPVLARTFVDKGTQDQVTVAVADLASRQESCDDVFDPVDPDGQGECNGVRTDAARALADWLPKNRTQAASPAALIVGNLNAYEKEDPIDALRAAGWSDVVKAPTFQDDHPYSQEDYSTLTDGELGRPDYALANSSLVEDVAGAAAWHINADEPDLLDYDTTFKAIAQDAIYAPDAYRSSDHDPVLVGLGPTQIPRTVNRLEGRNRYETAAAIARQMKQAGTVYVASGDVFPDALAGAPLAIGNYGPILLTKASDLPDASAAALAELSPQRVILLGGERRIDRSVAAEITAITGTEPTRIEGANRYDTAAKIARRWDPARVDTIYLASGEVFADALAAGPLAGSLNDPILLTAPNQLPKETAAALEYLSPERIVALGGETRISFEVLKAARAYSPNVTRLAGADRYQTAALIAARVPVGVPDSKRAFITSGLNFPDALGGSVLAGTERAPLLLNRGDRLIDSTAQALLDRNPVTITLLGGPSAVSEDIVAEVHRLLR